MQILEVPRLDIPTSLPKIPFCGLDIGAIPEERLSILDILGKLLESLVRIEIREYEIQKYEIKYESGCRDEYYTIKTKDGLLNVPKPRDALLELKRLGEQLPAKSLSEVKDEINKIMGNEFVRE
jgi:hypothetical protein